MIQDLQLMEEKDKNDADDDEDGDDKKRFNLGYNRTQILLVNIGWRW